MDLEKPKRRQKKQKTDYLSISKRFTNAIFHSKTYSTADGGSDRLPVIWKPRITLQSTEKCLHVDRKNSLAIKCANKHKQSQLLERMKFGTFQIFKVEHFKGTTSASNKFILGKDKRKKDVDNM